jgi:uncharacterized membrane protein
MAMGRFSVERSLEIDAPARLIWDELMDVARWPEWKPFITGTRFSGNSLGTGSNFRMKIKVKGPAVTIPVRVCEFLEHKKIAWTGGIPGAAVSVHSFILDEKGDVTLVTSREEFTGALVLLMLMIVSRDDLLSLHERWLEAIRQRVEPKDKI